MGNRKAIEKLGLKLNDDIKREYQRATEINELKNPLRAFEYYIIPIMIGLVSWLASVMIHYSCSTDSCNFIKGALSNVYGFLFVIGLIVFWQHIRMTLKYVGIMMGNPGTSLMGVGSKRGISGVGKHKVD